MLEKVENIKTVIITIIAFIGVNCYSGEMDKSQVFDRKVSQTAEPDTATFAGGCFWCVEAPFEKYHGINDILGQPFFY